ncbi:MAG TPA: response regulator transcription factor [Thermomicrobiales bacterium]|jgi:DNA-binding response OmpR family regulator
MTTHILIVDDDPLHAKLLTFLFADAGYQAAVLVDPRGIDPFLRNRAVDLILLGVARPSTAGFNVCAQLRDGHPDIPVILLMGERGTTADLVCGFDQGADDYIVKPYEAAELLARVQSVLRRYRRADRALSGSVVAVGETRLDLGRLSFFPTSGRAVLVTPTEMRMLECLMRNARSVTTREQLIAQTWGYESESANNRLDVYMRRLRHKIEAHPQGRNLIRTIRGIGYSFMGDGEEARDSA